MIEKIIDSIFSKIGEKLVEYGRETVSDNTKFKSTLEKLKGNLKSLSAKTCDIEKEISSAERSGKKKRKREVENWLKEVKIVESELRKLENEVPTGGFIKQFFGGDRPIKLNERVCQLVEQSRHFGELVLDDDCPRGEALLATRLVGEAFDRNLESILKLLVIDKVSRIGVHGMGGVGKSTLAKHINNKLLERTQECVLWVTVSHGCSVKMLQDKIARVVDLDLSGEEDEDKRAARLNRKLYQKKNFILILDDVWEYINLEEKVGVPLSIEGCKLMMTTRSFQVCQEMNCQEKIAVNPLREDEGWNLFLEKLGRDATLALRNPEVEKIAKCMVEICNGLPLGIKTLAGAMSGVTDIVEWRHALRVLKESPAGLESMEDEVFKVLKYSFDRLNPNDQRCFLYCSLYPEDSMIQREELVRKFISEELVNRKKSWKAQLDEGHSILNRLVKVSLLESDTEWFGQSCVKMHDLVRAMALEITKGKTMVIDYDLEKIPDEKEWTVDLEKVSLMENSIEEIPLGMSPICPKLSTLLLQDNPLKEIPESFFSRMCGLCILDLSGTVIKKLPNSVSDLERLKALLLGRCVVLEYVPYLGRLKALRELDLSFTAIREVPEGMEELVNLEYLSLKGACYLEMLPTTLLLNLTCLQLLYLPKHIQLEGVERLKQLEVFEGGLKDMRDFNRFIESRQNKTHSVSHIIIVGEAHLELWADFNVCDGIKKLMVSSYDFKNREQRDRIMLVGTQYLHLQNCEGLSNSLLADLGCSRSLEKLEIEYCRGIECIMTNTQLIMAPQQLEARFLALEKISLDELDDFMGVIYDKQEIGGAVVVASPPPPPQPPAVFSSLRSLAISGCNKMKKLGLPFSVLQNLEIISIHWCKEIEEIIEVGDDNGRGEGEAPLVSLPKLKEINLGRLPSLNCICRVIMMCNSLEAICLMHCTTLKKVPLYFPKASTAAPPHSYSAPPALRGIKLFKSEKEWWDSLDWDHDTHKDLLQPLLKFI